jgi:hypothetical protein
VREQPSDAKFIRNTWLCDGNPGNLWNLFEFRASLFPKRSKFHLQVQNKNTIDSGSKKLSETRAAVAHTIRSHAAQITLLWDAVLQQSWEGWICGHEMRFVECNEEYRWKCVKEFVRNKWFQNKPP